MTISRIFDKLFVNTPSSTCAHLTPQVFPKNHLFKQIISDDNLNAALDWLRDHSKNQDHSDTWDYARHWADHKATLQHNLQTNTFQFQTVREVEIKNSDGHSEYRELRCAQDRLLIRAMSQVLQAVFADNISPQCVNMAGRGGTQQAVQDSHAQLRKQPNAYIMKSDVKGYYAHIDHPILLDQFTTLLPQESQLQRLLTGFLRRSVERGGNYRDIPCGIPLGSSLSPLLGTLYLSPLDALYRNDNSHFYRRYMDDWVIFCKNRWDLRHTVKKVYAILQALKVEIATDKTYIGKTQKGFDFLGKRILPIGVLPSTAALSRMQAKTIRLYEQGASKQRVWKYWMRWLGWAFAVALAPSPTFAYLVPTSGPDSGVNLVRVLVLRFFPPRVHFL